MRHIPRGVLDRGLRRLLHALIALPAGLAGLLLGAAGRTEAADAVLLGPLRRLLGVPVTAPGRGRLTRYAAAALPLNVVSTSIAAYLWAILLLNLGYPLRPDVGSEPLEGAWGGPTIAGAWAVHAVGGTLTFALVGLPLATGLAALQRILARRLLP
jgi:hypothetical protein